MDSASCTHPQQLPPPPSPSPTWAEVAGGGQRGRGVCDRGQPPPVSSHSTPARPAYVSTPPVPSAHTQFMAWLSCRRAGIPARLVLETDGTAEEFSFWCRPPTNGDGPPAKKRRRRRRRRQADGRRVSCGGRVPPPSAGATAGASASGPEADVPHGGSNVSPAFPSPPAGSPPAKRPRTRAAARAGRSQGLPKPEISRAATTGSPPLDLSLCSPVAREPEDTHPPGNAELGPLVIQDDSSILEVAVSGGLDHTGPHTIEDATEGNEDHTSAVEAPCERCNGCEADFEEDLWRDGRRLNTRDPPWERVFHRNGKICRFCRRNPEIQGGDGSCLQCRDLTTFQLIVKYTERIYYKYHKQY